MKILYVTTVSSTINAFLVPHIEALVRDGHRVDVACAENQPLDPAITALGCHWYPIEFTRQMASMQHSRSYRQLRQLLKTGQYDVVHTHTPIASLIVRLASRGLRVKVVYTAHGFHFHSRASKSKWALFYSLEWLMARRTDLLITMNDEDYKNAHRLPLRGQVGFTHGIGYQQATPSTGDAQALREQYELKPGDVVLIFPAELSHRKNQAQLIRAMTQLPRHFKLLLLGDGPLRDEYETQVRQTGVSDQVIFTGFQKDVAAFLAVADIAVSSSRQEGLPVNIMEALSLNLPVVASDIRGHADLIEPGTNGYLYRTTDELVHQIQAVAADLHQFDPVQVQALLAPFSLPNVQAELAGLYRQLGVVPAH